MRLHPLEAKTKTQREVFKHGGETDDIPCHNLMYWPETKAQKGDGEQWRLSKEAGEHESCGNHGQSLVRGTRCRDEGSKACST